MSLNRLRVVSANFYYKNSQPEHDARLLRDLHPLVVGIQEGHGGNVESIRHAIGDTHDVRYGHTYAGKDVPVVYPESLNVLSFWSKRVSERAEIKDIGMPRAASVLRFKKGGETFCFINTHLNAAVQGPEGRPGNMRTSRRVFEYTRSIIALERIIKRAKKRGEHVIVVGDLNFKDVPNGMKWLYSPRRLFDRCGMDFRPEGLDYAAWTSGLTLTRFSTVSATHTGSDHPWLVADLAVIPIR